ncbi:DUF2061 domain-containing protein [Alteromonas gracilis]|uniref:DUF2061 domain-containing protein n=1 Tax=Alteromonas gracilis TaxID=1479524 RepID=UPI003735B703
MKKTITFAVMHFSVAFTVAYILTGSVVVGGAVALVEPAINTVAFYFHELVWKKIESNEEKSVLVPKASNQDITFVS